MAAKYDTPFLTVIYNNQGWSAPKRVTTEQHPGGYAVNADKFWSKMDHPARLDLVAAAAGGAFAKMAAKSDELCQILQEGREAVKNGRSAVINVMLPPV